MGAAKQETNASQKLRDMLKIQPKGNEKLFRLEYHNSSENSHKFYECWISIDPQTGSSQMFAKFGRVGTDGQKKQYTVGNRNACLNSAAQLKNEKMNKGYKEVV